ncbi:protein Hydra magnipapillata [Nesidiocoris tenuis]|uniref:Protein Hydra magnipapillata n=1 Tax=Nesidiocoris tenuis TaxID=355587 RepID=A0ABN7B9U7_9HEMI|nr:protein Hydra magnipapillata [Nesidiocoris tenuis]
MLRAHEVEGQDSDDPFMPLPTNLPDFDDGINIGNLDDSTMSDWLDNFSANGGVVPDELLSVTELLGLSGSGLIGANAGSDLDLRSPEKFQDLKFTSTPKAKSALDSGFADESLANKSIEYKVVLNDITDKLAGNIFTSLKDVCESSGSLHVSFQDDSMKTPVKKAVQPNENNGQPGGDLQLKVWERNVPIIRRRIRTMPVNIASQQLTATPSSSTSGTTTLSYPPDLKRLKRKKKPSVSLFPSPASLPPATVVKSEPPVTCSKCREPLADPSETEIGEAELMYYTGIKKHKSALGIIKFMRLPDCSELSTFKRILVTIMKLRFDFPYEDLGFRLRKPASLVKEVIGSTAAIMSAALIDFIPWSEPPTAKCASAQRRSFYLTELKHSEMKVIVLIEDKSNLPICYVSELFDPSSEAMDIAIATCSSHFVDGDLVCFPDSDVGAIRKATFYKVVVGESGVSFKLADGKLNEGPVRAFLTRNAALVSELEAYLATNIGRMKINSEIPIDTGIRICSALINVNYLPENNLLSYFQQVFARSSQATAAHRLSR